MSRKLLLTFGIIAVIIPMTIIILFGVLFLDPAVLSSITPGSKMDSEMGYFIYIIQFVIGLIALIFTGTGVIFFTTRVDKTPEVKWIIISTFISFIIYIIYFLLLFLNIILYGETFITEVTDLTLHILEYAPLLLVPFFLINPMFIFANLYSSRSSGNSSRIIV